ncbi:MAG: helix-turn-helix domain-containing protein [Clostridia bacterium]
MKSSAAELIVEKSKGIIVEKFSSLDLNVSNLANYLNITIEHLSRTFKKVEGENINNYIIKAKIAKACEYIRNTEMPINKISLMCGFVDYSSFRRNFKKFMNLSPNVYRKKFGKILPAPKELILGNDVNLPMSDTPSILFNHIIVNNKLINNRIVFQPMECFDGSIDGSPSERTINRYKSFAEGGPGIIWFESVAVAEEGRSNPCQLYLQESNIDSYKKLVSNIKQWCYAKNGFEPIVILQATHSGKYSAPNGIKKPLIAYHSPFFENEKDVETTIVTDEYLKVQEDNYVKTALLSQEAGFDGIDIKSCHKYLISDLLGAYTRKGEYGGSFENRTKFLRNVIAKCRQATQKSFIVTTRLNMYDGLPYPYGFGVNMHSGVEPDFSEGLELIKLLSKHIELINITIGNPFINPHLNRPFDKGGYLPPESPLVSVKRLIDAAKVVQQTYKDLKVVCSGLSYLKEYSINLAAGCLEQGYSSFAGFARLSLSNPNFPNEISKGNGIQNYCITCSKCSTMLINGRRAYCAIRGDK